jgi:predicted nuclease of predicted toxin-antitoxin system
MEPAVAVGLRRHGIKVVTTVELGIRRSPDIVQLQVAMESGRVMVTFDPDFLDIHDTGQPHAGIVYLGRHNRRIGQFIDCLRITHSILSAEDMVQHLERF